MTKRQPVVVFSLTGDILCNSRAIRQVRALEALGCRIEVLTFGHPAENARVFGAHVRLHILPRPKGSGPGFFYRAHRRFMAASSHLKADVFHASDLFVLPAMASAARRGRARLVFDARELYAYVSATRGRPWVRLFWYFLEHRFIQRADTVFTVNESIAQRLTAAYGIAPPIVLPNVPAFSEVTRSNFLRDRLLIPASLPIILHQGSLQRDRGCGVLVEAMQSVDQAVLVFLGNGPLQPALEERVRSLGLSDRVHFVDAVPPDALLEVTASADIGVTLLEDTCLNHRLALPNKLFEYLMAGLPVLASDLPEISRIVNTFDVGEVVDPADTGAVAGALRRMVTDEAQQLRWRNNTRKVFETFSWESASQGFQEAYLRILQDT